jgi:hypothetical protein
VIGQQAPQSSDSEGILGLLGLVLVLALIIGGVIHWSFDHLPPFQHVRQGVLDRVEAWLTIGLTAVAVGVGVFLVLR